MIYCFDIDGTICTNTDGNYKSAKPFYKIIERINKLFEEGNTIYFYTARGTITGIDWCGTTKNQLKTWGVKYHKLYMGKPTADLYVDDKGINIKDFINDVSNL